MRNTLIAMLVISACFAGNFEQAVQTYIEPGMQVDDAMQLTTSKGTAYVVKIEGQEMFIIGDWSSTVIQDEEAILRLLEEGIVAKTNSSQAKRDLKTALADLAARRAEPEFNCSRSTGTEKLPCYDKESCIKAAGAGDTGTLPSGMIYADGFWQAEVDWLAKRTDLNITIAELQRQANSQSDSQGQAEATAGNISLAIRQMQALDGNRLFTDFFICPKVAWPYSGWQAMASRWRGIAERMQSLDAQPARAHQIAARTAAWLEYMDTRKGDFASMKLELNGKSRQIGAKLANYTDVFEDDRGLELKYGKIGNASKAAIKAGDSGQYRVALTSGDAAGLQFDEMEKTIDADLKSRSNALKHLSNALKASAKIKAGGDIGGAADIVRKVDNLNDSLHNTPKATNIYTLEAQAKQIESSSLTLLATGTLGIDVGEETAVPENRTTNASSTSGNANASKPAPSLPTSAPTSIPPSLPCAIPAGIAALGAGGAAYMKRKKGEAA